MKSFSGKRKQKLADDLLLYAITDRAWINVPPDASEPQRREAICAQVSQAIAGGATIIQMREKHLNDWDMVDEADALRKICNEAGVPFIVNDDVAVAVASQADGVHIGQDDMAVQDARAVIGARKILGVSAQTVEEAIAAEEAGADYLGVGAVFPTSSKDDAVDVSLETLTAIVDAVNIPVVAIGGITGANVSKLASSGICGVSVISAIFAQKDITAAAADLKQKVITALH